MPSVPSSLPLATQVTMKLPSPSVATEAVNCAPEAALLTRNSAPTLRPAASNSCALIALSSPSCAGSSEPQTTTKPPSANVEIDGAVWFAAVKLLTANSSRVRI